MKKANHRSAFGTHEIMTDGTCSSCMQAASNRQHAILYLFITTIIATALILPAATID